MIYPANFEVKIDFQKIRHLISERCFSTLGKEKVELMHFSSSFDEIEVHLLQTEEFLRIIKEGESFPLDNYFDMRPLLKRIGPAGSWIDQNELFDLRRSLETIYDIVFFFRRDAKKVSNYPQLSALSHNLVIYPDIIKRIEQILDQFGGIKDNASAQLMNIRRELNLTITNVSKILNSIMRKAQMEGYVEKGLSPGIRDGRLVIPINPSYKRKIKGIVHDESATGKTLFVEPSQVVEANNRVRELEGEERREIIKILLNFTDYLRNFLPDLLESYDFLATIDFIQAKASFANSIGAIKPSLENCQMVDWVEAIHPLLDAALKKQRREIVPLDIKLDSEQRILVISGPNAGGKSVCLKTVGLLQYMVQCGLLIPLKENSKVGIFKDIFIDIGDEQSIENDLSTYSSHLKNMSYFVKRCNEKSLLLIDEFGSGTEPKIGAAIAEALLGRFNQKKTFAVITTHYQNLKHFANEHEGVVNGAMLFDRHHMKPLFHLSIGNPGSSFAVEIARNIGLEEGIIAEASTIVGSDYVNMDRYLQDIARDRRYWELKRDEIRRKQKHLDNLSEKYESSLSEIKKEKREILSEAKLEAEQLLSESNAIIEKTIREIKEAKAERKRTKEARERLNSFKTKVESISFQKPKSRKSRREQHQSADRNRQLKVGDAVRLKGQTSSGEIIAISGKKAKVAFGMIKSTIAIDKLEQVSRNLIKKEIKASNSGDLLHERRLNFKQEIDVRGMRGDEAAEAVLYYIDDAVQLGVSRVRILHGTGTGALRQIIREYLATVDGVAGFRDEQPQFGGTGITIVDIE